MIKEKAKYYLSLTEEWNNSIYSFNNKYIKTLYIKDMFIYKLLSSYLNIKKIKSLKKKHFSIIKLFISKPEIKHNSHSIIITLYFYNKEKVFLKKSIYNILKKTLYKEKKFYFFKNKSFKFIFKDVSYRSKKFNTNIKNFLLNIVPSIKKTDININKLLIKYINYYIIFIRYNLKRFKYILYFKKNINKIRLSFNNYKFNIYNFLGLKYILSKIYLKKIEFNLVNLKYLYLDSNILTEAIGIKLKNRKNSLLKNIIKAIALVRIPSIKEYKYLNIKNILPNLSINNLMSIKTLSCIPIDRLSIILYNLKYKSLKGISVQGSGRLTRRLTALRSVSKLRQKGMLKNIYSSFYKISTKILLGYKKSNLQYIKKNYNNRNGSFGIKTYISSY